MDESEHSLADQPVRLLTDSVRRGGVFGSSSVDRTRRRSGSFGDTTHHEEYHGLPLDPQWANITRTWAISPHLPQPPWEATIRCKKGEDDVAETLLSGDTEDDADDRESGLALPDRNEPRVSHQRWVFILRRGPTK